MKRRRFISGALALLICCSTIINAGTTAAAAETAVPEIKTETVSSETEQPETIVLYKESSTFPQLDEIRSQLNEDEIVVADDLVLEYGSEFDPVSDFTKIAYDADKVKITFKEAVNENLEALKTDIPGKYQAVYEVVPVRDAALSYQIARYITISDKEPETEGQGENGNSGDKNEEKTDDDSDSDPVTQTPISEENTITETESETSETNDESKQVEDVLDNAMLFSVVPSSMQTQRSTTVSLDQGERLWYPSHWGTYSTCYFTVNGKIAYCLESPKDSPPDADYVATVLETNANLQKVLYYGYGGPGDISASLLPGLSNKLKYIYTHIASSYAYIGNDGFYGCSYDALVADGVIDYINKLLAQETPPTAAISLSSDYEKAYLEDDIQRTGVIQLNGDHRNYITVNVPANVTYYNDSNHSSQTGGSVKIYGGTKFHFTAPKTVTGLWETGSLKGQIGSQWKTLVISSGNYQDIGYGDFIEEKANSVQFSVKWLDLARITLIKQDAESSVNLSGAVFGVYKDEACTSLITKMPATDKNGSSYVEFTKTQETVYLREITAPTGYQLNTKAYNIKLVAGGNTDITVTNTEQKGRITIHKIGEKLTGIKDGNPISFVYDNTAYAGAVYKIYAADDIISQDKSTVIYKKDTLIETLTTAEDGNAVSSDLYLGKYRIVEVKAPTDLTIGKDESETTKEVTLEYAGQEIALSNVSVEYNNKRPVISVKAIKKSKDDGVTLAGAEFGLYAGEDISIDGKVVLQKDSLIETVTSDKEGAAAFTADIPIGHKYYIREITAPEKYYMTDEIFEFTYSYKDDSTYEYVFSHEFSNEEVRAEIHINKIDKETHDFVNQGDATLVGAEYGLFAAEDIQHPNKKSDPVYKKGDLVAKGKIDKNGKLDFTNLYLGKYIVKELTPSEGYLLDPTEYPVDAAYEGQEVKIVHRDVTVHETVKKQAFQLIKVGSDGEQTEADLLESAGFKIYLISSLKGVQDGTIQPDKNGNYSPEQFRDYDFSEETTALDYSEDSNGVPMEEIFTDSKGYAQSKELAYGKYVVIESTVPENYNPIDPFIVTINEDSREPQQWRVFIDYEFTALLKIYKIDGTSKLPVLHSGATFKIYDIDNEEYVTQYTHYPELVEHTEFKTSDSGYLMTPEELPAGHYRIEEVEAPEGYVKADPIEITLASDTAYEVEPETGAIIISMDYENERQTGTLRLQKTGEVLTDYTAEEKSLLRRFGEFLKVIDKTEPVFDFTYALGSVEGAEFAIYANETIYSPDYQTDDDGNRIIIYDKDELVATIRTDKEGVASLSDLPLGKYRIVETIAGNGYVLNKDIQEFELEYAGDEVEIVYHDSYYENERQKVQIQINKLDVGTQKPVSGAEFGLYAAEDILAVDGSVLVPADTLIETAVSDENGIVSFTKDLPIAHYYAKEVKAADGYVLNEELIDFNLEYAGQDTAILQETATVTNDYTKVEISKVDIGGKEIPGAQLEIRDSEGNTIESWTSDGTPHLIERLKPGDYVLVETQAPDGYEIAEEIPFTVLETGEIQKVQMVDEYEKTGTISVQKVGDMLTGTTTHESDFGDIYRMEYEKRSLPGVEFTIYDENGNVADVITTTEEGIATSKELELGKYTLVETKTPAGLAMTHEEYEVVLEKDDENKVVDVSLDIENDVVDTEINVYKVGEMINPENGTFGYGEKPLEGVYFGIYTNEDIKDYRGETALAKDSLIGVIKTNKEGKATLKGALVSGHYYYKELKTVEGFILDEEKHEFELTLENEPVTVFDVNKENPALNMLMKAKVSLIKVDAGDESKKLSGAEFELFTESGESLGVYITDENGEINITDLGYGKYYFKENKAPNGYQKLADPIEFSMKGENVTITCRNNVIPKLGFEDSNLKLAAGVLVVGCVVIGIGSFAYLNRKKKNKNNKTEN